MIASILANRDTEEQKLNQKLFQKLADIVGTEEDIHLRQQVFKVMDIVNGFGDEDSICVSSGSLSEGLDIKGSDEDNMIILKYIDVVPLDESICPEQNFTYLRMSMDEKRPGHAKLFLSDYDCNNQYIKKSFLECERKIIASSNFRKQFVRPGMTEHGPCIGDALFDFAICLKGTQWPAAVKERIANCKSKRWISNNVAKDLISDGCVYVPVGPRNSDDYDTLWRISFALSERKLIHKMNYAQILCYALLKIVLKELIDTFESTKDLLCSYFMKTCLFWLIEETDNDENVWKETKLFSCFNLCLDKIIEWVTTCNCPNYFIPQNNMFVGRIRDDNKDILLSELLSIKQDRYKSLLRCDSLASFLSYSTHVSDTEREANLDLLVCRALQLYPFDSVSLLRSALDTLDELYNSNTHNFIQGVIHRLQVSLHKELAQMMRIKGDALESARIRLQQKCHLLKACSGDTCCGFILLASFYHVQGYHYTALEILKTATEKLQSSLILTRLTHYSKEVKNAYMASMCGRGFSMQYKMRHAILHNIVLMDESSIVPKELEPEVNHCRPLCIMPPAVYAYGIKFLCYHHLNDRENKENTLQKLEKIVMTKYFVFYRYFSRALTLLGACYEINRDTDNARRCYSMALDNPPICQSVAYRLKRLDRQCSQ